MAFRRFTAFASKCAWRSGTGLPISLLPVLVILDSLLWKWNIIYIGVYSSSLRFEIVSSGFRSTISYENLCQSSVTV